MEDLSEAIADFPITISLHFRNFSKQVSTSVALAYEAGWGKALAYEAGSGKIQKILGKTAESLPCKAFLLKIVC